MANCFEVLSRWNGCQKNSLFLSCTDSSSCSNGWWISRTDSLSHSNGWWISQTDSLSHSNGWWIFRTDSLSHSNGWWISRMDSSSSSNGWWFFSNGYIEPFEWLMSFLERMARTILMDDEFFRTDSLRRSNGIPVRSNSRWTVGERLSFLKWLTVRNVFTREITLLLADTKRSSCACSIFGLYCKTGKCLRIFPQFLKLCSLLRTDNVCQQIS